MEFISKYRVTECDTMERIRELYRLEKIILLVLIIMFAVFTVLYIVTSSRVGYEYMDSLLIRTHEGGNTVYAGEIYDKPAQFTVTANQAVTFEYAGKTYGPYTVKEDPSAIPANTPCQYGIEIRRGDNVFFRGGYVVHDGQKLYYDEEGQMGVNFSVHANGNVSNADMTPSIHAICSLAEGPELTHRGSWGMWFLCLFLSVVTSLSILFAEELFHFHMSFRVQDADMAEPSQWEISRREIGWIVSSIIIFIIYFVGLF